MNNEDTQSKTENSVNGFEKLIQVIPVNSKILDVGAGGHEGANTTNYLVERFGASNVLGINIHPEKAEDIMNAHPHLEVLVDDFYNHAFTERFDAVVLVMNI